MAEGIEIREAERPGDALDIAEIHLAARREAMPYLHRAHTDDETQEWFARMVGGRSAAWWVALVENQIVGYLLIDGETLDLYMCDPVGKARHRVVLAQQGEGDEPTTARTLDISAQ